MMVIHAALLYRHAMMAISEWMHDGFSEDEAWDEAERVNQQEGWKLRDELMDDDTNDEILIILDDRQLEKAFNEAIEMRDEDGGYDV